MVAFWRGQITGNMDMGVPVGIPIPVVGVILAKTTVPDPVCAGNGNRDQSNHDNDQKEHEEENQYLVTVWAGTLTCTVALSPWSSGPKFHTR